jgi:hypothetical protein
MCERIWTPPAAVLAGLDEDGIVVLSSLAGEELA